ncbi:MAG: hypothetical protein FWD57_06195 [Polyangiaceae bacterium]|nr:hypothetical protein [Polyangiaceae bacterium]
MFDVFEVVLDIASVIAVDDGDNELLFRLLLLGGLAVVERSNRKRATEMYAFAGQILVMLPRLCEARAWEAKVLDD